MPGITIEPSGTFELAGANLDYGYAFETIGSLTMYGGTVQLAGAFEPGFNIVGFGTNYGALEVNGPISIEPSAYTSFITGHGLGWLGSNPGTKDTTDFQSAALLLGTGTNVMDVEAGAALIVDSPIATGYVTGGGLQPIVYHENNLFKTGGGILWTTGTNAYAGNTIIQQGEWVAAGESPFGSVYNATNATSIAFPSGLGYLDGPANNRVTVSNGATILAWSPFTSRVPLELNGQGYNGSGGALSVSASGVKFLAGCKLASDTAVMVGSGNSLTFDTYDNTNSDVAALSGTNAFDFKGQGELDLTMSHAPTVPYTNGFSGTTLVEQGTFALSGQPNSYMLNGPLTVGTNTGIAYAGVNLNSSQVLAPKVPVIINGGDELYINGASQQTMSSLLLNGGYINGSGTLILNGDLTALRYTDGLTTTEPQAYLNAISLGGTNRNFNVTNGGFCVIWSTVTDAGNNAGITKTGLGELLFNGTYNCAGPLLAASGALSANNSGAFAPTCGGVVISNNTTLFLYDGVSIGNALLHLAGSGADGFGALQGMGSNSWAGTITLSSNALVDVMTNQQFFTSQMELSGLITGPGGLTKLGGGNLLLDGSQSNSYAGSTLVQQGPLTLSKTNCPAIPGALTIGQGLDGPNGDAVYTLMSGQLSSNNTVNISSSGLLDVSSFYSYVTSVGSLTGAGNIQLGNNGLDCGFDNSSTLFSGPVNGTSSGYLLKYGAGAFTLAGSSSFAGILQCEAGELFVNGSMPSTTASFATGGVFGGTGAVGAFGFTHGTLAPGNNAPGILNSGNVSLNNNDTFLAYVTGTTSGSGYGQLNVTGTVSLGNAALQLNMTVPGVTNSQLTLINNDASDAVTGTFSGLAEGATLTAANGAKFKISYHGGTGNDVVLTQITLPPQPHFTGVTNLGVGGIQLSGIGITNLAYTVWANTNLVTTNWITIGSATASGTGMLQFTDTNAPAYKQRFYRFTWP